MDLFRIINDIAAETRMSVGEKVRMLMRILVCICPRRIECHRRAGPESGALPETESGDGDMAGDCHGEWEIKDPAATPHPDTR